MKEDDMSDAMYWDGRHPMGSARKITVVSDGKGDDTPLINDAIRLAQGEWVIRDVQITGDERDGIRIR